MNTLHQTACQSELAKTLAAEDIRCGDVVAVLDLIQELPSFLWTAEPSVLPPGELVRLHCRNPEAGRPLRVEAVCLPYLLVSTPAGRPKTLDVRQCRLVRLSEVYARKVWKRLRKAHKRRARQRASK